MKYGIKKSKVSLISDSNYYQTLKHLCSNAKSRIYASLFIIDIETKPKDETLVANLIKCIALAKKRGVDVKLAIGGSNSNYFIQEASESTLYYCRILKVPCKIISYNSDNSSHKKIVIVDDNVLVGSHNWSHGSFTDQMQDTFLVYDKTFANFFSSLLNFDWFKMKS